MVENLGVLRRWEDCIKMNTEETERACVRPGSIQVGLGTVQGIDCSTDGIVHSVPMQYGEFLDWISFY